MPDVRPDPKPVTEGGIGRKKPDRANRKRGRVTASRDGWIRLRREKLEGKGCRICGYETRGGEELHHLVPRSQGGDDVADNLVALCTLHHRGVTLRDPRALGGLAAELTDAEYAYIIGKLGEGGPARLFGGSRSAPPGSFPRLRQPHRQTTGMSGETLAPVRLCCGERHYGAVCPDGKVMCCLCFERFALDELSETVDGDKQDVCLACAEAEADAAVERTQE